MVPTSTFGSRPSDQTSPRSALPLTPGSSSAPLGLPMGTTSLFSGVIRASQRSSAYRRSADRPLKSRRHSSPRRSRSRRTWASSISSGPRTASSCCSRLRETRTHAPRLNSNLPPGALCRSLTPPTASCATPPIRRTGAHSLTTPSTTSATATSGCRTSMRMEARSASRVKSPTAPAGSMVWIGLPTGARSCSPPISRACGDCGDTRRPAAVCSPSVSVKLARRHRWRFTLTAWCSLNQGAIRIFGRYPVR